MAENWKRWINLDSKKGVAIGAPTHKRLQELSAETGMSMQFWADAGLRVFFAHQRLRTLVESAKGVTLEAYDARVRAIDKMIYELAEAGAVVPHAVSRPEMEVEPEPKPAPAPVVAPPETTTSNVEKMQTPAQKAHADEVRNMRRWRRREEMAQRGATQGR